MFDMNFTCYIYLEELQNQQYLRLIQMAIDIRLNNVSRPETQSALIQGIPHDKASSRGHGNLKR